MCQKYFWMSLLVKVHVVQDEVFVISSVNMCPGNYWDKSGGSESFGILQ